MDAQNQVMQAPLNRMDFWVHEVIALAQGDVAAARIELGELRGAIERPGMRAQEEDTHALFAQTAASHRSPGTLPAPSAPPLPPPQAAALAPAVKQDPSPGKASLYNRLGKATSKPSSPDDAPANDPEHDRIATPLAEFNRLELLADYADDMEQLRSPPGNMPGIAAHLADDAPPRKEDEPPDPFQSPVPRGDDASPPLGSLPSMVADQSPAPPMPMHPPPLASRLHVRAEPDHTFDTDDLAVIVQELRVNVGNINHARRTHKLRTEPLERELGAQRHRHDYQ